MSQQLDLFADEADPVDLVEVVTYRTHRGVCSCDSYAIIQFGGRGGPGSTGAEIRLCAARACPLPLSSNAHNPPLGRDAKDYVRAMIAKAEWTYL